MPTSGRIRFTAAGGGTFVMDGNGLAYRVTNGVRSRKADAGESVDLRDDLDLVSLVWAKDEAGNAVAIVEGKGKENKMTADRKMAMAERAVADVIDCLNGIVSEQGYEGLRPYTVNPVRMMAELGVARKLLREYAHVRPAAAPRNCDKYPNAMMAHEVFREEHPRISAEDAMREVFGWLYDRPAQKRRKPSVERGVLTIPGQPGHWNYAVSRGSGKGLACAGAPCGVLRANAGAKKQSETFR